MKNILLNALRTGVVFYPCSGNDFEMINTINNYNSNSKDFIYCDSGNLNANVGYAENIDNLECRINERFEILQIEEADIRSIYPIENIYHQLGISYGAEYNIYVEGIENRVTLYKLKNCDDVVFNLFYFRAESVTLFRWLNCLKLQEDINGNNTLVINAPGGGWLDTAEFIALLYQQAALFNVRAIYNWDNFEVPYQLVNQNNNI
jgi:hypothetical protein